MFTEAAKACRIAGRPTPRFAFFFLNLLREPGCGKAYAGICGGIVSGYSALYPTIHSASARASASAEGWSWRTAVGMGAHRAPSHEPRKIPFRFGEARPRALINARKCNTGARISRAGHQPPGVGRDPGHVWEALVLHGNREVPRVRPPADGQTAESPLVKMRECLNR